MFACAARDSFRAWTVVLTWPMIPRIAVRAEKLAKPGKIACPVNADLVLKVRWNATADVSICRRIPNIAGNAIPIAARGHAYRACVNARRVKSSAAISSVVGIFHRIPRRAACATSRAGWACASPVNASARRDKPNAEPTSVAAISRAIPTTAANAIGGAVLRALAFPASAYVLPRRNNAKVTVASI